MNVSNGAWQRNLYVLWVVQFITYISFNVAQPFIPLFLSVELGMTDTDEIALWSGLLVASNSVLMIFLAPLWGQLADRVGRKIMVLRALLAVSIFMGLSGFAQSAVQLLVFRLLMGAFSGYSSAVTALVGSSAPRTRLGYALGLLQNAQVAGTLLGPLVGGGVAALWGYRWGYWLTAILTGASSVLLVLGVTEKFTPPPAGGEQKARVGLRAALSTPYIIPLLGLYGISQLAIFGPTSILALYIAQLDVSSGAVNLVVGLAFAATAISAFFASPIVGRWADRNGYRSAMLAALAAAGITFVLHALAQDVWQMLVVRLVLGVCVGALVPTLSALIGRLANEQNRGAVFGLQASAHGAGNLAGPVILSAVASVAGFRASFIAVALILFAATIWGKVATREPAPISQAQAQEGESARPPR